MAPPCQLVLARAVHTPNAIAGTALAAVSPAASVPAAALGCTALTLSIFGMSPTPPTRPPGSKNLFHRPFLCLANQNVFQSHSRVLKWRHFCPWLSQA